MWWENSKKLSLKNLVRKTTSTFFRQATKFLGDFFLENRKMMIFKSPAQQMRFVSKTFYETIPIAHCIYCGEYWEVYDHVPPVAAWCINTNWAFKYPACKDCNAILRAIPIKDIRIRRYIILKRLFSRYKRIIKMPNWEKYEINELKGFVKGFIKISKQKKDYILQRIEYLSENYRSTDEINLKMEYKREK